MQSRTPSNPCFFFSGNDWTDTEALVDQVLFFDQNWVSAHHPAHAAAASPLDIGNSNYNALTLSCGNV